MKDHRQITFVINSLVQGGAESQVRRLSVAFAMQGWDVSVVTLQADEYSKEDLEAAGVNFVCLNLKNFRHMLSSIRSIRSVLTSLGNQVIVGFLYQADLLVRLLGRTAGYRTVISSLRNEKFGGKYRELLLKLTDHRVDLVTTNSANVANKLMESGHVTKRKVHVVPNAIDIDTFVSGVTKSAKVVREQLSLDANTFVWITMGRMRPQKNYTGLVEAFARMESKSSVLVIAGQHDKRTDLSPIFEKFPELRERVRVLGPRTDIPDLLNAANAFVMASHHEGSPNALIEASLMKLPAVVTDVGGTSEIVGKGSPYLIAPGDMDSLKAAMLDMESASLKARNELGQGSYKYVIETHGILEVVDRWESIIRRSQEEHL